MNFNSLLQVLSNLAIEQAFGVLVASTILCALGLLGSWLARQQSASMRATIWNLVCFSILASSLSLFLTRGMPMVSTARSAADQAPLTMNLSNLPGDFRQDSAHFAEEKQANSSLTNMESSSSSQMVIYMNPGSNIAAKNTARLTPAINVAASSTLDQPRGIPVTTIILSGLVVIWLGGIALFLVRFFVAVVKCYSLTHRASRELPVRIEQALNGMDCAGLRTTVRLTNETSVPFAIGIFWPTIVLPDAVVHWSNSKLQMVMAHELSHVARADVFWHWIGKLAQGVAWFNPLVWIAIRQSIIERERACDERVVDSGVSAIEYSQSLLEVAAQMCGKFERLFAGVSIAEPPLKSRLSWILGPREMQKPTSRLLIAITTIVFVAMTGVLGTVRPLVSKTVVSNVISKAVSQRPVEIQESNQESPASKADPKQKQKQDGKIQLPPTLQGTVTDIDGEPIAEATVEVSISIMYRVRENALNYSSRKMKTWTIETDNSGRYEIETDPNEEFSAKSYLYLDRVVAAGRPEVRSRFTIPVKDLAESSSIPPIRLTKGRVITGLITSESGERLSGKVTGAASDGDPNTSWFSVNGEEASDDGAFSISVPTNSGVELMAYAEGYAPTRIAVPNHKDSVGSVVMPKSTALNGSVVDLKGNPIAGVVVGMSSLEMGKLDGVGFNVSANTMTDLNGKFEFSAGTGKHHLTAANKFRDSNTGEYVFGKEVPFVKSLTINVGEDDVTDLVIRESETVTIQGTASWENGQPAAGLAVTGRVGSVEVSATATGADGTYSIKLPKDESAILNAIGAVDSRGVWHMASGDFADRTWGQIVSFENLDANITGVDWNLSEFRAAPMVTAAEKASQGEFEKLRATLDEATRIFIEEHKAKRPEEGQEVYFASDPRNAMAAKYMKFEREHRGEKAAIMAIKEVFQRASSVGDSRTKISLARNELIDILIKHYLGHADLADVFRHMFAGPEMPRDDMLFRMAYERSPYPSVQAAALMARADRAASQLQLSQMLPDIEAFVAATVASAPESHNAKSQVQQLEVIRKVDQDVLRKQTNQWLDNLIKDYSSLKRIEYPNRTYGESATHLKHFINQVQIGKPAPAITATDIDGIPFDIGKFKGKPVILTFCYAPIPERLRYAKIKEQFGEQVALVWIVKTLDQEKFIESQQTNRLPGVVILESLDHEKLSCEWNVRGQDSFVISPTGELARFGKLLSENQALTDVLNQLLRTGN